MVDQKQKIKELIKLNDELENYFCNTLIPQLFVDRNLVLRKFTPPAMKQFSLKAGDIGRDIDDVKDNFRFPTILEDIGQVIKSNKMLEKEIQTTDSRWYQMNVIPYVIMKTKRTDGVIITFIEITARVKDLKNQELLIAGHETLLDTISHDIKGPLASLLLTIGQLKKVSADKSKKFVLFFKILESSVKKMQSIITDLTDATKLKDQNKIEEELIDFKDILDDVRLTLAGTIMESGAVIASDLNVSEILYSRRKLRSIVYNLVNNAIKFHSPKKTPEVQITTKKSKNFVVITVKDNGIGIDKSKHEEVFSKYTRVANRVDGSGVGLYLVNEIVVNSGGKITLKSKLGKGSEFSVYLPVK